MEDKKFIEWFNEMSPKVYEANKAKGWWDEDRSYKHIIALIISEMAEAMEADRQNNFFTGNSEFDTIQDFKTKKGGEKDDLFKHLFKSYVKDTFEDEIADTIIRILDFAGAQGFELADSYSSAFSVEEDFAQTFYNFCDEAVLGGHSCFAEMSKRLMQCYGFERIKTHIELKLKYNSLRPKKHGKQY